MLAQAIEAEAAAWIEAHAHLKDEAGHKQLVRNGHLPERTIQTGLGSIGVQQRRVRDRRPAGQREAFSSALLPPYLRKTRSLEELVPWLYLKGVSTGDFSLATRIRSRLRTPGPTWDNRWLICGAILNGLLAIARMSVFASCNDQTQPSRRVIKGNVSPKTFTTG
jgi:hypothetical protein